MTLFATADDKKAFDCDKEQPRERDSKIHLRSTSENHILNAKVIFDLCMKNLIKRRYITSKTI